MTDQPFSLGQAFQLAQTVLLLFGGWLYLSATRALARLEDRQEELARVQGEQAAEIATLKAQRDELMRLVQQIASDVRTLLGTK